MKTIYKKLFPVIISIIALTGCGSSSTSLYSKSSDDGYVNISKVDGITFNIPEIISTRATAITRVADDQEFESNNIYSYANGDDEYMLFCMNDLIVLAQKGTTYGFSESDDKDSCLDNSGVLDSWCDIDGKKLNYIDGTENGTYKIIANVDEEISITTEMYGDYVGKLSVIDDGENEWSLLVGVKADSVSDMSSEQADVVNAIASSMTLSTANDNSSQGSSYAVIAGSNSSNSSSSNSISDSSISMSEEEKSNAASSISSSEEITDNADAGSQSSDISGSSSSSSSDSAASSTSVSNIASSDGSADASSSVSSTVKSEKSTTPTEHTNQTVVKDKEAVLESNVYSMLDIGDMGLYSTMGEYKATYGAIRLNKIYTGDEAKAIIKEAAAEDDLYDYFDAPDGYSWQVAEYDIYYHDEGFQSYVDVKMEGLDGHALVYRGVKASQRTYDADNESEYDSDNNRSLKMRVYYAVPNGCNEYVLKFGDGTPDTDNGSMAAYYYIKNSR